MQTYLTPIEFCRWLLTVNIHRQSLPLNALLSRQDCPETKDIPSGCSRRNTAAEPWRCAALGARPRPENPWSHKIPVLIIDGSNSGVVCAGSEGNDHAQGSGVLYSATKAAVHMFSFCLADEVREHNIAVNILSPGGLKTEGSADIPWTQRDWEQRVEPEAVGPSAVYLALQDASTLTGQLVLRAEFGETWGT